MIANSGILSAVRTESIQDVVSAVVKVLRDLINLLTQSQIVRNMFPNGKKGIEKSDSNNLGIGMKETCILQGKNLLKPQENIIKLSKVAKSAIKELLSGIRKILKSAEHMIERCMRLKQVNLFDHINVQNVPRYVNLMLIMRIIQNHWMSFGSVLYAISTYIINQNITVREQARKLRKEMRCSELLTKAVEVRRNDVSPRNGVNRKWQAGGKSRFIYLPPGFVCVQAKSSLIVLNSRPSNVEANKVQATERWAA